MDLKGTKTEGNLAAAFAGESQMSCRYAFYADRAEKDGYGRVAAIFRELSSVEREHARLWFRIINYGDVPKTRDNLLAAARGERLEHAGVYSRYARDARAEGFPRIADLFGQVARVEQEHERLFLSIYEELENGSIFEGGEHSGWRCAGCGHRLTSGSAPDRCPVCSAPRGEFARIEN